MSDLHAALTAQAFRWGEQSAEWYYENRHTHPNGIQWVQGFESGWDHAGTRLQVWLAAHPAPSSPTLSRERVVEVLDEWVREKRPFLTGQLADAILAALADDAPEAEGEWDPVNNRWITPPTTRNYPGAFIDGRDCHPPHAATGRCFDCATDDEAAAEVARALTERDGA